MPAAHPFEIFFAGCLRYTRAVCFLCRPSAPGEGEGSGQTTDSESGLGLILLHPIVWLLAPILHRVSSLQKKPRYPIIKTSIKDFLTNEEVLPIIQKSALMSLVQWSQAHGQELKRTESDCQSLAQSTFPPKKSPAQSVVRLSATPIDEDNSSEGGLQ